MLLWVLLKLLGLLSFVYRYLYYSLAQHGANYGNVARNVPTRARGAATGIAIVVLQIGTLIISQVFPILVNMLEVQYVFLIFAVIGH